MLNYRANRAPEQDEAKSEPSLMKMKPIYRKGCRPGWYILESNSDTLRRGPYRHIETAGAVREEMERHQTDRQAELWNLNIYYFSGRAKKPPMIASNATP